ncbi:MAG: dihydrofolate reductase [Chloroflexota bacterium]
MASNHNQPKIIMVAALDQNRIIGVDGEMPWHLPEDLKHFRRVTKNRPVIMGRKTFESIGRPLPKRVNIILTRDREYTAEGIKVVFSAEEGLAEAHQHLSIGVPDGVPEIMIIGGAQIYSLFLPYATDLILTYVAASLSGDTIFPEIDEKVWAETSRQRFPSDEKHRFPFDIVRLTRI